MEKMHFAGTINSEETMSGLLPDGRRIYVQILSVYPMPTVAEGLDPLYWLGRLEACDFDDEENDPIVWVERAVKHYADKDLFGEGSSSEEFSKAF